MTMKRITVENMLYEIEIYYDCEGRIELFQKWAESATEENIKKHYNELFKVPNLELEEWEERCACDKV